MKTLDQYETPISDAQWADAWDEGGCDNYFLHLCNQDKERRLAACRLALERLIKNAPCPNAGTLYQVAYDEARKTLTLTAP